MLRTTALFLAVGVLGADAPKKDANADKLEGTWIATSYIDHGKKANNVADLKFTLILKDGKYTLKINGMVADEGTYTIDASKNPKHIDTVASVGEDKGKVDRGIYELKGDTLKTAFDEVTKQNRPTAFDSEKFQVVEFARAK